MDNLTLSPPYVKKRGENNYVVVRKRNNGEEFIISPTVYQTEMQAKTFLNAWLAASEKKPTPVG